MNDMRTRSPFALTEAADPRDTMIAELWKRIDDYRTEEKAKLRRDVDQAHAKIRFLRGMLLTLGTAFAGAAGTALIKVLFER